MPDPTLPYPPGLRRLRPRRHGGDAGSGRPNLEWTYLDPSAADPRPQVCHGHGELAAALAQQAERGLRAQLEEVIGHGNKVVVTVRTPSAAAYRVRQSDDRDYTLFTMHGGRIVALRDCRDRDEALSLAGIEEHP
jgi:hypothetical protein